jgi:hypothetical protein
VVEKPTSDQPEQEIANSIVHPAENKESTSQRSLKFPLILHGGCRSLLLKIDNGSVGSYRKPARSLKMERTEQNMTASWSHFSGV